MKKSYLKLLIVTIEIAEFKNVYCANHNMIQIMRFSYTFQLSTFSKFTDIYFFFWLHKIGMTILIRHSLITNSNLRPNKAIFNNVADFKLANISKCHNKQNTKGI